ncbi:MAG: hypothetical protein ABIQ11_05180 [Saprospiraceae bacterium]
MGYSSPTGRNGWTLRHLILILVQLSATPAFAHPCTAEKAEKAEGRNGWTLRHLILILVQLSATPAFAHLCTTEKAEKEEGRKGHEEISTASIPYSTHPHNLRGGP